MRVKFESYLVEVFSDIEIVRREAEPYGGSRPPGPNVRQHHRRLGGTMRAFSLKARLAGIGIAAAVAAFGFAHSGSAAVSGTINISASVNQNCSITTAADSSLATALSNALTSTGAQTVTVGTVAQSCNKRAGYTLTVSSGNCTTTTIGSVTATPGAKLINAAAGSEEYQLYSVGFTNPSGTSPASLLQSSCSAALGRDVTGAKVSNQTSTITISFTTGVNGVAGDVAGAGTFSDTLTIDMTVK
jgi:hypothetical protein